MSQNYYKNAKNDIYVFAADGSEDDFIPDGLEKITENQAKEIISSAANNNKEYPRFVGNQKLDLFSQDEQLAVVTATMQDPAVKLLYDRLLGAAYWSYEDAETEQGLSVLVAKGLLTAERRAEIVAAMQPH